jgi:hypothetical protein
MKNDGPESIKEMFRLKPRFSYIVNVSYGGVWYQGEYKSQRGADDAKARAERQFEGCTVTIETVER